MVKAAADPLVSAVRRIHAVDAGEPELEKALLDVLSKATASTSARLRRPADGREEIFVGREVEGEASRLEQRFPCRAGMALLTLERPATTPFDERDASALEILGGEVVLRLEQAGASAEASRARREIELLRALSRTRDGAPGLADLADRAARELLATFTGAHVLVYLLVNDRLELVARRTEDGNAMADAPDWSRVMPLDMSTPVAIAARERRIVSRSAREAAEPRRAFLEGLGIRHTLAVPLIFQDVVLGSLMVAHRQDEPWDSESLRLLEGVVAQLGSDLAQARLLEAERRRADDLGLINELGSLVAQHLELRAVLSTAASGLGRALAVPRVHVFLADETKTHLRGIAAFDGGFSELELALDSSGAVAQSFRTLAPVIVEDAQTDDRTNKALVAQVGTRSLAVVPLVARGEAMGVIALVETRQKRRFTDTEVARAVAVANVVAPAVTNAKMFEDLRRSYEALAKAQADLVKHERLAALGELSAVIAHEVRNPIAVIFNSLSELRRLAPRTSEASLLIGIVGEEASRLNRLVGDLLDFVRPYEVHPRRVRLDGIIKGAVEAARRAAPEPRVEIQTEVCHDGEDLWIDGTMLQQALLNLIVNAIQATPRGKTVTVRAGVVNGAGTRILRCEVADEGVGLDAATRARIFQPFFTTKATGTGLGLALVRRLTDALGGAVVAESRPAGGAQFVLTVPVPSPSDG
jgi:signal transduction histidine kinase